MADASQKKETLQSILTAFAVAAVLIALLLVTSRVTIPKNNDDESGEFHTRGAAFVAEPADSLDVLFVGDSEVFSSFRPNMLWYEYGFTSYDCSEAAQRLYLSRNFIRRAFETQHPKLVVLETDSFFLFYSFGEAFEYEMERYFPVFRNHSRWKSLTAEDFTAEPRHDWINPHKGFRPEDGIVPASNSEYMEEPKELQTIPPINQHYLDSIIDMCREHGAIPVVVSVPSTTNWNKGRHDFIVDWAEKRGVDYYDFNMDPYKVDIDWKKDTRDGGDHLNMAGSKKLSLYAGKLLDDIYDLPDHRDDPAYAVWNTYTDEI